MATWYISSTGNDTTGNGSLATPWLTVGKANASASVLGGDILNCLAGTYTWATETISHLSSIVGAGFATTIFDAGAANTWWRSNGSRVVAVSQIQFTNAVGTTGDLFRVSTAGSGF